MARHASELARRLAREAETVCRHYLSNGKREGRYWLVGDVHNTPGRSLFVLLQGSSKGPARKRTDPATSEHRELLNRNRSHRRCVPEGRSVHRRPGDGCLRSQYRLRGPSLRLTCTAEA